jgi:hypothetical protein
MCIYVADDDTLLSFYQAVIVQAIEHSRFTLLDQQGLWILQTVSVESCRRQPAGENTPSHRGHLNLNWGVVAGLTQRLHIRANDIANTADFGVAVDFIDAGLFLAKTIL